MLTPRDILNVEFKRGWKGYSEKQVDEFLQKVVTEYEAVYKENQQLKERIKELKDRVGQFSQSSGAIDETLQFAKQAAADSKAAAKREAETILRQARVEADDLLREARQRSEENLHRLRQLEEQEADFRERFRTLLESFWELLQRERPAAAAVDSLVTGLAEAAATSEDVDDDPYIDGDDGADGDSAFTGDWEERFPDGDGEREGDDDTWPRGTTGRDA